jgi:hypothetical protein
MKAAVYLIAMAAALTFASVVRADYCEDHDCVADCDELCFAQFIPPNGCFTACGPYDDGSRSSKAKKRYSFSAKRLTREQVLTLMSGKLPPGFVKK